MEKWETDENPISSLGNTKFPSVAPPCFLAHGFFGGISRVAVGDKVCAGRERKQSAVGERLNPGATESFR